MRTSTRGGLGEARRFARVRVGDGAARFVELGPRTIVLSSAPWSGGLPAGELSIQLDKDGRGTGVRRLAPVTPAKILCVGRNYRAHASELGNEVPAEPLLFLKPTSSLCGPDDAIELPPRELSARVEHEAEIAVVIGRRLRRASADEAMAAVFGVTLACDVTARDLQRKDNQWTRAKGMDTFCPVGPVVVSGILPEALSIRCKVSGELRQQGSAKEMIFSVGEVLAYASQAMTLEPGDLLLTGTPSGVGPLEAGDRLEIESEPIGVLGLPVRGAS